MFWLRKSQFALGMLLALLFSFSGEARATAAANTNGVVFDQPLLHCCFGVSGSEPEIADDFVVPPGTDWLLNAVSAADSDSAAANVVIYAHDATTNKPGATIARFVNVERTYVYGSDERYTVLTTYHLPEAVHLTPGHYWISLQANGWSNEGVATGTASRVDGPPAMFRNGQFGWLEQIEGYNAAFTIYGVADSTPPEVICNDAPTFLLNQSNALVFAIVSDPESGVVSQQVSGVANTSLVGPQTIALSGTNGAAMTTTVQCPFNVAYQFSGLLDELASAQGKSAIAGQLISLRWRLTDANGVGVSDPQSVRFVDELTPYNCRKIATAVSSFSGSAGLSYLGDGYWRYNWKTDPAAAGQCRTFTLAFSDQVTKTGVSFAFK